MNQQRVLYTNIEQTLTNKLHEPTESIVYELWTDTHE